MYDSFIAYTRTVERAQQLKFVEALHSIRYTPASGFDPKRVRHGDLPQELTNLKVLDLDSPTPKAIINYGDAFYPYLMFFLGQLLAFYSKPENRSIDLVVISNTALFEEWNGEPKDKPLHNFIKKVIEDYGVNVSMHFMHDYNAMRISNFYIFDNIIQSIYPDIIYNEVQKYVVNKKPATRKVLVSRKIRHASAPEFDNRVSNDELVEDVFKSLGFEVVYSENFEDFVDQINYFSDVKVIAGVTGAGLANSVLMPPGGTLIELSTILNFDGGPTGFFSEVHEYYKVISLFKKHLYFSISNVSGKAEDFVNNKDAIDMIRKIISD